MRLSLEACRPALPTAGRQKAERKIKEFAFQNDQDKKNQVAINDLASKLQSKIKTSKKDIEEAEEIAALNLAKFKKRPNRRFCPYHNISHTSYFMSSCKSNLTSYITSSFI